MNAAIAGLVGATIGALAGIVGAFVTQYLQAWTAARNWLRDKREEGYSNALRYLLKTQNRGSLEESFNDLIETQFWVTFLSVYCSQHQRGRILGVESQINSTLNKSVRRQSSLTVGNLQTLADAYDEIADCAKEDIGRARL